VLRKSALRYGYEDVRGICKYSRHTVGEGTYFVHDGANGFYITVSGIRKQLLVGNFGAFCDIASSPLSSMATRACVRSASLRATSWAGGSIGNIFVFSAEFC